MQFAANPDTAGILSLAADIRYTQKYEIRVGGQTLPSTREGAGGWPAPLGL